MVCGWRLDALNGVARKGDRVKWGPMEGRQQADEALTDAVGSKWGE